MAGRGTTDPRRGADGEAARRECEKAIGRANGSGISEERVALAREALAADPRCADAHSILAREAGRSGRWAESLSHARRAVTLAEEAFDPGVAKLVAGTSRKLWRRKAVRPYLRALCELARALRATGDLEDAIRTARTVLDRAGFDLGEGPPEIRSLEDDAALWLVEAGRADEAFDIMDNVERSRMSAPMMYTQAIAFLMTRGYHSREMYEHSLEVFLEAVWADKGIAVSLLSPEPEPIGPYTPVGLAQESARYVRSAWRVWQDHPGAIALLEAALVALREALAEASDETGEGAGRGLRGPPGFGPPGAWPGFWPNARSPGALAGTARILMTREPAAEEPDEATFKAALEGLIRSRARPYGLRGEFVDVDSRFGAHRMLVVLGEARDLYRLAQDLADAGATRGYFIVADDQESAKAFELLGLNAETSAALDGFWGEILPQTDGC